MYGDASAHTLKERARNVLRRRERRMLRDWSTLVNGGMYEGGRYFNKMTLPVKTIEAPTVFAMDPLNFLVELGRRNYK